MGFEMLLFDPDKNFREQCVTAHYVDIPHFPSQLEFLCRTFLSLWFVAELLFLKHKALARCFLGFPFNSLKSKCKLKKTYSGAAPESSSRFSRKAHRVGGEKKTHHTPRLDLGKQLETFY